MIVSQFLSSIRTISTFLSGHKINRQSFWYTLLGLSSPVSSHISDMSVIDIILNRTRPLLSDPWIGHSRTNPIYAHLLQRQMACKFLHVH